MTDNVINVWTKTIHGCELSDALNELRSPEKHKAQCTMSVARIARDSVDYQDIHPWFECNNPFEVGEKLVCLNSGIVDEMNTVTCDSAE